MSWIDQIAQLDPMLKTLGGVLVAGGSLWTAIGVRAARLERSRQSSNENRYDSAAGANKRLFEDMGKQIAELERRCSECEEGRAGLLEHAVASQLWMLKVQFAADASGMKIPSPPILTEAMLRGNKTPRADS